MKQNRSKEFSTIRKLSKRVVDLEERIEEVEKILEVMLKQKQEQVTMHQQHRIVETHKVRQL